MCDCLSSSVLHFHLPHFPPRCHSTLIFRRPAASLGRMSPRAIRKSRISGSDGRQFYGDLGFKEKGGEQLNLDSTTQIDVDNYSSGLNALEFKDNKSERSEIEVSKDRKVASTRGRQLIRRSNVFAKQVICIQSATSLGFVSQTWVDTDSWKVLVVEIRPNLLSGESERFPLESIKQVGDVILVEDENVLDNELKMVGLETLVGYKVITPSRQYIGKVRGYYFDINSGVVELLELDSFGISVIPSSLVSTYALAVGDIIEVLSDTVIVHEAAASQIHRLTKGFWDAQNVRSSVDETDEYFGSEISESGVEKRDKLRRKSRKFQDDWELPMDYL